MKITDITLSKEHGNWGLNIDTENETLFAPCHELNELNEDAMVYMNDPFYYKSALNELAQDWVNSDFNLQTK